MSQFRWTMRAMNSPADQPAPDAARDPSVAARMEHLYECHASLVRSVCGGLLRDRVEAEDAMQQTFLSAHRALLNGSSPRDEAAWLATIARHESLARVKARMREPLAVDIDEHEPAAPDVHAAALGRHEAGELRDALAELPPQQREAILLRELRGLSYQEVAATLAVTNSAVESLLFRARRSLQARLQGALAALSPGCWVQSLRDLGSAGSSGVTAPVVKVAAVGVGTALFAGGALGPKMLGLGHAPTPATRAARPAAHHIVSAAPAQVQEQAPVHLWRASAVVHPQQRASGGSHASEASDAGSSSAGSERDDSSAVATRHDDGGVPSRDTASSSDDSTETNDSSDDSRSDTTSTGTTTTTTGTTTTDTTSTDTTTYPVTTDG
jgi:RNA polymerase sigma-70 factor (ECF subfamily)